MLIEPNGQLLTK